MENTDFKKITERNKEFLGAKNLTDEEFLGEGLFESVWNSKGYLIENVGVSFIINTLRNGSDFSNEDKVKIFDKVLNDWMEEVFKNINGRNQVNG